MNIILLSFTVMRAILLKWGQAKYRSVTLAVKGKRKKDKQRANEL